MLTLLFVAGPAFTVSAQTIPIVNHSFEDISGQSTFNEFTFGVPAGWELYNPDGIVGPNVLTGTLNDPDDNFFDVPAPDGTRVAILYNGQQQGNGIYGLQQTLEATLQANTIYQLDVEVGNIASGSDINGTFFDLSGFPGYRIELLADLNPFSIGEEVVIASDDNTLFGFIGEGEFATSGITVDIGATHAQLGESLGIRLINLNEIRVGIDPIPDLEVDFDNVQLATVPEPSLYTLIFSGLLVNIFFLMRQKA